MSLCTHFKVFDKNGFVLNLSVQSLVLDSLITNVNDKI